MTDKEFIQRCEELLVEHYNKYYITNKNYQISRNNVYLMFYDTTPDDYSKAMMLVDASNNYEFMIYYSKVLEKFCITMYKKQSSFDVSNECFVVI